MVHVKICGLSRPEDVAAARDADAVGFVIASPKSRRNVTLDAARELARGLAPFQVRVAVTAASDADTLEEIAAVLRPDALQLPFRTPESVLKELRERFPDVRRLMAVRPEDAHLAPEKLIDGFVVDAVTDDGYGGSGVPTDWQQARALVPRAACPVVLAGGLTTKNVGDAIRTVRPYGVDVSSGVEGEDGLKDPARIRAFLRAAREAALETEGARGGVTP